MNISSRDRALLAGIAAIAVIAAFYVLVISPEHKRAATLQTSIAGAQHKLTSAEASYTVGRAAQRRVAAIRLNFAAAQRAVPATSDIPALLRLLQQTAKTAHVSISSISLSGSAASTSSASTAATSASSSAPAAGATSSSAVSVPVALTFGGGYTALSRMVRALNQLVVVSHGRLRAHGPLVGISSVALSQGSSSSGGSLSVQLTASIYQRSAGSTASSTSTSGGTS